MSAALCHNDFIPLHFIDDTVSFTNTPASIALLAAPERFGLTDTRERTAVNILEKGVYTF